jgi:yersiniabactin synthetase, thiazolinyl reductase component
MPSKRRVLVVGAKFGEVYLNSFFDEQPGFELCGLLAKGSPRAHQLAKSFGIPLYTDLQELPDAFDVACIVVRSTVVGGNGTFLAESLLRRGIHVIQEHPVHPSDIERLQMLANSLGLVYWINSFYPHTAAGRCWISAAKAIRSELDGTSASFAHLTTSRQLLYSSLDLLVQAIEGQSVAFETGNRVQQGVFDEIDLRTTNTQISIRLQNYMDESDPDQHSLIMHHCQIGWPSGYLTLAASYGPVIWVPTFFDEDHTSNSRSLYNRMSKKDGAFFFSPTAITLLPAHHDWKTIFEREGPDAVSCVLQSLLLRLDGQEVPLGFQPSHQLAIATLWQQILRSIGSPRQCNLKPPRAIALQKIPNSYSLGVTS